MGKKNRNGGYVYSTDGNFNYDDNVEDEETLPIDEQNLLVRKEKKGRGGKVVTLVERFVGHEDDLKDLAKTIKNYCGTGGSAKEGVILIQGDLTQKVSDFLTSKGYTNKKSN